MKDGLGAMTATRFLQVENQLERLIDLQVGSSCQCCRRNRKILERSSLIAHLKDFEAKLILPTVLVVDDDVQVSELVAAVLKSEGFSVLRAQSGEEAVDLAQAHLDAINLLVTDIVMPGMDGVAAARKIQSLIPGLPAILMSGACNLSTLDAARPASYLQKPFTPAKLVKLVQGLAGTPRAA